MKQEPKPPLAIIKRSRVALAGAASKAPLRPASEPACNGKRVRLVEHEGHPRAIEFACTCGETTLVELCYEGQPATDKTGVKS